MGSKCRKIKKRQHNKEKKEENESNTDNGTKINQSFISNNIKNEDIKCDLDKSYDYITSFQPKSIKSNLSTYNIKKGISKESFNKSITLTNQFNTNLNNYEDEKLNSNSKSIKSNNKSIKEINQYNTNLNYHIEKNISSNLNTKESNNNEIIISKNEKNSTIYSYSKRKTLTNFNNTKSNNKLLISNNKKNSKINTYKEREIYSNFIYQYYNEEFIYEDYNKAKIILFFGINYEEKRQAINALINIIKGINLETKEKFILIKDKQLNTGIYMYYIKDCNNNPYIFIDCIGYNDINDKDNDDKLNEAFKNLFEKLIKNINLVIYIIKESDESINIINRYGIGCATGLFSENILKNFIFLVTNIDNSNIKQRPQISMTLFNDIYYDYIKYKMDEKWFYSINVESIFNDEINDLSNYSYSQLNELYQEKIQNSTKVNISKSLEIIKNKLNIKTYVNNIRSKFKTLKEENKKIPNLDSNINSYSNKINSTDRNLISKRNRKSEINYLYKKKYLEIELQKLEKDHNLKMLNLDNEYETIKKRELESSTDTHTYCKYCKNNCHHYCDCFSIFSRCTIFPVFGNDCEKCGHKKSEHAVHVKYHYVDKEEKKKIPNDNKKKEENEKYNKKKNEINNELNRRKNENENIMREIDNLEREKKDLLNSKNYYVNEKNKINNNMKILYKDISDMISNLINISNLIENNAVNKFQIEIENNYIDYLINEINQKDNDIKKIERLKKNKEINKIYQELCTNYFYLFAFKCGTK